MLVIIVQKLHIVFLADIMCKDLLVDDCCHLIGLPSVNTVT